MSYSTGEALLLAAVQACASFDSTNTSRANWKVLDKGKSSRYAILRPGAWSAKWVAFNTYNTTYQTVIEIWQRYTDETTTHTNLYALVAEVLEGILPDALGGDILSLLVSDADEPEEMWTAGGGPSWLRWSVRVNWTEEEYNVS